MNTTDKFYFDIPFNRTNGAVSSSNVYSDREKQFTSPVDVDGKTYSIINYGENNQIPYQLTELVEKNSVMLQNKYFNLITCYGRDWNIWTSPPSTIRSRNRAGNQRLGSG